MDFQQSASNIHRPQNQSSVQDISQAERIPNAPYAALYPVLANPDRPARPDDEVHSAFIYYLAKKGDKTLKAQCIRCGLVRIKSLVRQRQHLLQCQRLVKEAATASQRNEISSDDKDHSQPTLPNNASQAESASMSSQNGHKGYPSVKNNLQAPVHDTQTQAMRAVVPSGGNHPLSTFHHQAGPTNRELPEQVSPTSATLAGPQQHPWMSHHTPIPADTFPRVFQDAQTIKIEPNASQPSTFSGPETPLVYKASNNEIPVPSVEVEDDCDDSAMDESSNNDESSSHSGAESEEEPVEGGEADEIDESWPFDEDDEDTFDGDNDLATANSQNHAEGQFGPSAVHKRRRRGERPRGFPKGQKRGPKKPADPGPEFTALQNEAMRVFIEEQDNQKAMRLIQNAISTNPEIYSAHALLSEILFAEGEDQKAVDALYLGAHSAPRDADIWQGVADACLRLTTVDRELALRMALHCYRRIVEIDEHSHDALFQRAAIYHEMGNYGRALIEYNSLLKVMPYNTSILRQKARVLVDKKLVNEAIQICKGCIAHGKGSGEGLEDEYSWPDIIVYTDIFANRGQVDEAIATLKKLSRWLVDRQTEEYWDNIVEDDREWDAEHEPRRVEVNGFHTHLFPLEVYGQALPLEIRIKLGLYRLWQGTESRMEACGHFEWLEPDDLSSNAPVYTHKDLFLDVAKALKDVKEHHEAMRFYDALLSVEAFDGVSFWLQVAATSYICGRKEQSRQCYEEAKASDPKCVEARLQLAMLYVDLKDKVKALQNAEEAVKLTTAGIKKSDRRRYEKHHQKTARKAADRVLKIVRRIGRTRARHADAPLGPAAIRKRQEAQSRREKRLTAKIEKQKKIYERHASQKHFSKQSEEQRTSKVQQLYSNLTDATLSMRDGDAEARATWIDCAQQMIADFCATPALFPLDRHMRFEGFDAEAIKRSQIRLYRKQLSNTSSTPELEPNVDGNATDQSDVPTQYCGLEFTAWLDIFLETALLHAKSGHLWKEACYALLKSAHDCSVWYHDPDALLQIYTCYFACALELHDEHTLLFTVGRWFIKQYQFCTDTYRLFAALNLLYTEPNGGKPVAFHSEFRSTTTQKFMMRKINEIDSLLPDEYNVDGEEGPVPSYMRKMRDKQTEDEDEVLDASLKPKEMDVVLLCLYGHILYSGDTFVSALNYFYRALTLDPKNPMALLSIALCYVHEVGKRGTEDRHMHVLNGMAVFEEYAEARMEQAGGKGDSVVRTARKEIEYNRARLWQMLGLSDLALKEYGKVLELDSLEREHESSEDWSMEAAFAMANLYASNGDPAMARHITEKWLVIE